LRLKNRIKALNAIEFHNNSILNQKVQAMFANRLAFVSDRNYKLPLEIYFRRLKFDGQRRFVACLK